MPSERSFSYPKAHTGSDFTTSMTKVLSSLVENVRNMEPHSEQKLDFKNIPVGKIIPGEFNPRKEFDPEYIRSLAKSLKRDGQWDPILVRKRNNGMYELIAGECRLRAAKSAGLKFLKARILKTDDVEALVLALKTNILRHNLNPVEESNALKELIKVKKDLNDVVKSLNKNKTWVLNRLKLAEYATEGLKTAVLQGELLLMSAVKVAELSEGLQGPVASKAIRERLNFKEVKELVELFKKARDDAEIGFLLQAPVKDYLRAVPYSGKRPPRVSSQKKPTLLRCECGSLYIVDWIGGKVVSEKVINHESGHEPQNYQEIRE